MKNQKKRKLFGKVVSIALLACMMSGYALTGANSYIAENAEVNAATVTSVSSQALKNTSTVSSSTVTIGKSVTLNGVATGGTSSYQYAYYYQKPNSDKWETFKGYSSASSVSFKPYSTGTYNICIKVKDTDGKVIAKYFNLTVLEVLKGEFTMGATEINLGQSVKLTASATGGTSLYQYAYYYKKPGADGWATYKGYSSASSASFKPYSTGIYKICIKAKDTNGTVVKKYFTLKVYDTFKGSFGLSSTEIDFGQSVTLTATATGGKSSYQYAYYYQKPNSDKWETLKGYSSKTSVSFKPLSTGTYNICIKAKDANNTVTKKQFSLKVNEVYAQSVTLNKSTVKLFAGQTEKISAAVMPTNTTNKSCTFSSSNTYVATVDSNGTITGKSSGTAVITVKTSNGKTATCTVKVSTIDTDAYVDEVISIVNAERAANGLAPLEKIDALCDCADIRAKELVEKFDHERPDGSSCFTVMDENNVKYGWAGENIAYGYKTPESVMEGWMNSEGHRANILFENFSGIGVGCYEDNGKLYWVQMFIG